MMLKIVLTLLILVSSVVCNTEHVSLVVSANEEGSIGIGILPFQNMGEEPIEGIRPWAVIASDLDFSGRFRVERVNLIDSLYFATEKLALYISGTYEKQADSLLLNMYLYDAFRGDMLLGKQFRLHQNSVRAVSHRFANIIHEELLGEKSPYESRILFVERNPLSGKNVAICDYDGAQKQTLINKGINLMPTFAEQNTILWVSFDRGKPDIFTANLKTGKRSALIYSRKLDSSPEYSPIVDRIVFASSRKGNMELYTANRSGNDIQRLTVSPSIDVAPAWSPNGYQIAFVSDRSGSPQIYFMDNQGANVQRLTFNGTYHDSPTWSPDGDKIAYTAQRNGQFDIMTISLDGTNEENITGHLPGSHEYPAWSPDGSHIAFTTKQGAKTDIYMISLKTKEVRQLTKSGTAEQPSWSNFE